MKKIRLNSKKGFVRYALVDDVDFNRLNKFRWHFVGGYVSRSSRPKSYMHWDVIGKPKKGFEVDHINGDGLDNQRKNLRIVTHQQNISNRGKQKNNKSGHKGVSWNGMTKKWHAQIGFKGKIISLGYFDDLELAAQIYRQAAKKYHGKFVKLV